MSINLRPFVVAALGVLEANAASTSASPSPAIVTAAAQPARLNATRSHTFSVALPSGDAFTLFEPMGERVWAEGWEPEFATPADATLTDGTVFTVARPGPDGTSVKTIWLLTHYAPADGVIEYRMVMPDVRVARISVQCQPATARETRVRVTYRYTSLSAEGDGYIGNITEQNFRDMIAQWDAAIKKHLAAAQPALSR